MALTNFLKWPEFLVRLFSLAIADREDSITFLHAPHNTSSYISKTTGRNGFEWQGTFQNILNNFNHFKSWCNPSCV